MVDRQRGLMDEGGLVSFGTLIAADNQLDQLALMALGDDG
jgi:hypothetical protein